MKVRLFSEVADQMEGRQGWHRGEGDDIFVHDKLGRVVHVAMCKDDGAPMWDQFLHLEPVGAICVPINLYDQVGMVRVERPSIKDCELYQFPDLDLEHIGTSSLEFPRGFPFKGEGSEQTAGREAAEELGSPIRKVLLLGRITPNTSFHPHRIPVYLVEVDSDFQGDLPPDVNEKILRVEWIHYSHLKERVIAVDVHCGMTLAAMTLVYGIRAW